MWEPPGFTQHNPAQTLQLRRAAGVTGEAILQFMERGQAKARSSVHRIAQRGLQGSSQVLPHLSAIQESFGPKHDVTGVKAHVGGAAAEANTMMGAEAYATDQSVAFKRTPDLHTAAHEAAHIVQQRVGVQLDGGVGKLGDRYEQHADAVADRVVQGKSAEDLLDQFASTQTGSEPAPVQAKGILGSIWDGVKSFGEDMWNGSKNLVNISGLRGTAKRDQSIKEMKRVVFGLKNLATNVGQISMGLGKITMFLVEKAIQADPAIKQMVLNMAKQELQKITAEQAFRAILKTQALQTKFLAKVLQVVATNSAIQNAIAKFAAKAVTKALTKKVLAKMAQAIAKKILTKVAVSAGAAATGVGIPISIVSASALVRKSGKASQKLQQQYPGLYSIIQPMGLDIAWFVIDPMIPDLKTKIQAELLKQMQKPQIRQLIADQLRKLAKSELTSINNTNNTPQGSE